MPSKPRESTPQIIRENAERRASFLEGTNRGGEGAARIIRENAENKASFLEQQAGRSNVRPTPRFETEN